MVKVRRDLGHHSPSFTLDNYVHLLPGDGAKPLDLDPELAQGGNRVATRVTGNDQVPPERELADTSD